MPRTIEETVFKFDELSDNVKENARQWYRECVFSDSYDWEHVYSDAAECAAIIGIAVDGDKSGPRIYFSGFSTQGDGACFEGSYHYRKGAVKDIRKHAPQDTELHRIADELQAVQRSHFYKLTATMKQGRRCWTDVDVENSDDPYRNIGDAEEDVRRLMRDFADWIYKQLETEYEYQSSDEAVDENILANDYEFDENGERV